ncbi:MAG: phosphatase PAP2 family protein [Candidatus Marinimicrobia bacterium]|nr:phosphatase PAP2 family protein [Candidatus Neomarinimicrobiota bacterium]
MVISDIAMRTSPEHSLASLRLIAEGVFGGQLVVEQLKMITGRERPNGADFKSFPSGHAAGSFGLATCLNAIYGKKVGLPAYAMAVFVATSRIQDNKHYLSDVIAGGLIGTMVARGFSGEYRSNWRLDPQISTRGIGMTLSINF